MKKNYFFAKAFAIAAIVGLANTASAQIFFTEDFEGTMDAGTGIPTGWTETGNASNGIWAVDNETNASSTYFTFAAPLSGTVFAYINDDDCNCTMDMERMILPAQDFATETGGTGGVNLNFESFLTGVYNGVGTVEVSVDNGVSWTVVNTIPTDAAWQARSVNLAAYVNESNLLISFMYNDGGAWADAMGINNVTLEKTTCVIDASVSAADGEYLRYPLSQVGNIINQATITNGGGSTVTNANVTFNVYDGTLTNVHTEMGTSVASIAVAASSNFTAATGYTPTAPGQYFIEYISSITESDCVTSNDTVIQSVLVDSVYGRDAADFIGVQGLVGIGTGSGGQYGNMFNLTIDDTLTQVQAFIGNGDGALNGTNLVARIYSWTGTASTEIAATVPVALDSGVNANTLHILELVGGHLVLGPGMYIVAVEEGATSASIGHTAGNNYTTNGTLVNATGITTDFGDQAPNYGGTELVPVIRAVFGTPDMTTGIAENVNNAFEVYPNPAVNNIMIKNVVKGSTVEIYNNLGQVIYSDIATSNNVTINISDLDNGIYTIKNISNDNVNTQSFVKQ